MALRRYMRRTDIRDTWWTLHMMEDNGLYWVSPMLLFLLWTLASGFVPNSTMRMEQVPAKYRLVTYLILEGGYHKESINTHEILLLCCSGVSRPAE